MTPIQIMDEIERDHRDGFELDAAVLSRSEWQSLRTAIEAQAHQDQKHNECAENLVHAREKLAQARARIWNIKMLIVQLEEPGSGDHDRETAEDLREIVGWHGYDIEREAKEES